MIDVGEFGDDEAIAVGLEMARIAREVPYPRAAAWARFQAWRITGELLRRCGQVNFPAPEIIELSDLAPKELRRLSDRLDVLATLEAADGEDSAVARWWRTLHRQLVATLDGRERNADALRSWIEARRRARPIGTPGDIGGLPSWRAISGE